MKKVLNLILICSLLSLTPATAMASDAVAKANEKDTIHIVKPEKTKVNKKREKKKKRFGFKRKCCI